MLKIYQIAYKNLFRKKIRTLLTISGVALSTWILITLFGFNIGYDQAMNRDIDSMGYQVLMTAKGCPYEAATLMLKGGTGLRYMPEAVVKEVTKHEEVETITSMLMQVVFDPDRGDSGVINSYLGIDPETYPKMKSYLKFDDGEWFRDANSFKAVLGYEAAELEQREIGDMILIPEKEVELEIVGILQRTGSQDDGTIFVPIKTLQKVFSMQDKLTGVGIKVRKEVNIAELEEKLYDLPDVQVVSLAQVKETISNLMRTAKVMVLSIAVIAVLIAMIGVINTILMSVFERFKEIGIMKSLGAVPSDIFKLIITETSILCFTGGVTGILISYLFSGLTDYLIRRILPYAPEGSLIVIEPQLSLIGLIIVIAIGLVSGIYPASKASRIRPVESMRMDTQ